MARPLRRLVREEAQVSRTSHTATFPVEQPDGSEVEYAVSVEWSVEVDGQGWWVLASVEPALANDDLRRDLYERASLEAHDRLFPAVEP